MENVVLVIHLILALAIIGLVLLQRSEGGGLGIGGGGGGLGNFASASSTANALTKMTAICAGLFFTTSIVLAILAGTHSNQASMLEALDNAPAVIDSTTQEGDPSEGVGETPPPSAPISE